MTSSLNQSVESLQSDAQNLISAAGDARQLEDARLELLGKKGKLTLLLRDVKTLAPEVRKDAGALLNTTRERIETLLNRRKAELSASAANTILSSEWIDVTLPLAKPVQTTGVGSLHPLTRVQRDLEQIFTGLGFTVVDGPEIERERYNFDALNVPAAHPARDMQDTIWTTTGDVLRTHTSSLQIRALERLKPPLRIVAPGRCFRYERVDASHEHTFYQMEGMMIDKEVSVAHLIYFMRTLLREIFGSEQRIRLRPGFFPFVEPGFELDIWFKNRWLELLPCGLVHPQVLKNCGIDPNEWQGFAFGLGLSRLVMSRYQIDDIRHFMSGDLRFLRQFP